MIPPEEVGFSTTAANLPSSEEPITEEPVDSTTEEEVTTAEVTTAAPVNMCGECDMNDIAPLMMQDNTKFSFTEETPVDGCKRTTALCQRSDDTFCNEIFMYGTNADSTSSITDETTIAAVWATFSCETDGTYSWMGITGITRLSCTFEDCE
ncbi:hypothetical protein CRE_12393 [Caenorhabditis remanei]|uniref:DUF281 domain-containing protein n=1 Tax=Caenorhabditis remanei TaxID=31234 RepID=E3NN99_CAERE|nr:hypothetical protein CRE_12393 [Caenorhabditis remanei]